MAPPGVPDWRDAEAYAPVLAGGRPALAWELLRRDPGYRTGWPSQSWLTFRQAQKAGGCVRKGERGETVVYADRFTPEAEKERASRDGSEAKAVPFLKRFTVFNVAQCEGLREGLLTRTMVAQVPIRVGYDVTLLGRSLVDHAHPLWLWAIDRLSEFVEARSTYDAREEG